MPKSKIEITDKELLKIVKAFRKGILGKANDPSAMCAAVSLPLQGFLSFAYGIECKVCYGDIDDVSIGLWVHTWLQLPDGRILDATASQFATPAGEPIPEIYLGEKPKWYKIVKHPKEAIE